MIKNCENSCEYCEHVNRGHDDCCHEVYQISDRCPLSELLKMFLDVNGYPCAIEWSVRYTGCVHFKEDLENKRQNEEFAQFLKEKYEKEKRDPGTG